MGKLKNVKNSFLFLTQKFLKNYSVSLFFKQFLFEPVIYDKQKQKQQ